MTAAPGRRTLVVVPFLWVAAGVLLLSSSMTRWFRTGPGSTFRGLELADNIRSGSLSPSWGVWVSLAVYVVIGFGGAFIATATLWHRWLVVARFAVALVGALLFIRLGLVIPPGNWALGPTMASTAFLIVTTVSIAQFILGRRQTS